MTSRIHQVEQHRTPILGVEAMTLNSNHHFPRHAHDQFGFGVIDSGAQRSWSGVGLVHALAGDVIMANPGEMHDGIPFDHKPRAWRIIYFDPGFVAQELEEEMSGPFEILRPVTRDPLLAGHFTRLFACLTASPSDRLNAEENLLRSLAHILHQHGIGRSSPGRLSPCVKNAIRRLDSALEIPVTLAELAALSGVSRFQLLRGFARETGITPHAYLIQRRVRRVRQLLAEGRTPAQAAIEAGFADQSHMSRAFVRQVGVTPSRYQAAIT
jgi:AraC-like DNA-binding protein